MSGLQYFIPIVALLLIFGLKGFREIKDYLLKREQIKSDAMVRAEALRLKNEIELEKLIQNDNRKESNPRQDNRTQSDNRTQQSAQTGYEPARNNYEPDRPARAFDLSEQDEDSRYRDRRSNRER